MGFKGRETENEIVNPNVSEPKVELGQFGLGRKLGGMLCGLGWGLRVVMGSTRNPPQTLRPRGIISRKFKNNVAGCFFGLGLGQGALGLQVVWVNEKP